ncbi:hypothetical protein D9611_013948 [Ephemerocybe angulata]|uniref:Uncharacterized protein n=1 Tax=Ephemerocybe angulata TaxID=980116 RepID=A0A8H5ARM1_9AGAR|nr:hypothetical protein D9611_013948 [Tulosesus angulatus]
MSSNTLRGTCSQYLPPDMNNYFVTQPSPRKSHTTLTHSQVARAGTKGLEVCPRSTIPPSSHSHLDVAQRTQFCCIFVLQHHSRTSQHSVHELVIVTSPHTVKLGGRISVAESRNATRLTSTVHTTDIVDLIPGTSVTPPTQNGGSSYRPQTLMPAGLAGFRWPQAHFHVATATTTFQHNLVGGKNSVVTSSSSTTAFCTRYQDIRRRGTGQRTYFYCDFAFRAPALAVARRIQIHDLVTIPQPPRIRAGTRLATTHHIRDLLRCLAHHHTPHTHTDPQDDPDYISAASRACRPRLATCMGQDQPCTAT